MKQNRIDPFISDLYEVKHELIRAGFDQDSPRLDKTARRILRDIMSGLVGGDDEDIYEDFGPSIELDIEEDQDDQD